MVVVSPSHGLQDFPFVDDFSFFSFFYGRSGTWLNFSFASKHSFYGGRFHSMVSKPSSEVSSAMVMVSTYIIFKPFSTNSLNNHKRRFSNFSNSDQNIKSW